MNKPAHFLLFLLALAAVMSGLSLLIGGRTLSIGSTDLSYYSPSELFGPLWGEADSMNIVVLDNEELDALIEATDTLEELAVDTAKGDSLSTVPSNLAVIPPAKRDTSIQVADILSFAPFFDALKRLKSDPNAQVRVLHFGDSQLEGDRITMQLRDAYQRKYGGTGFGYVALKPLVAPSALGFNDGGGFARKTVFGRRDTSYKDMRYGHLGSFTVLEKMDSNTYGGRIDLEKRRWGYARARNFSTARMHLEGEYTTRVELLVEDTVFSSRMFPEGEWTLALELPKVDEFSIVLSSKGPSRIYGLSFESPTGFHADNVAMRGASGMMFSKMNDEQFAQSLRREEYQLIVLQFGGNAVPYLKDAAHAKRFARALGRQLGHVQRLYPNAAYMYIGPSDMARKEGLEMKSYPLIKVLKKHLREEVMRRGAGYWDLYDIMGGEGSMVQWVEAEEPLAVKDYIHFTPKGAKKVGHQWVAAMGQLELEYNDVMEAIEAEKIRIEDSINTFKMSQGTGVQQP